MLNPQPHTSIHEPWIRHQFAQQLPIGTVRAAKGTRTRSRPAPLPLPSWSPGELIATHDAYEAAVRTIGASDPRIVAIEADRDSATYAQVFGSAPALRSVESAIAEHMTAAEQQMVATAIALQTHGQIPFAATFADSWTTAHDLIRMAAIGGANIRLIGSHAGVAGDPDGTSEQALEDIAMFRAIHNSTVLVANTSSR